MSDSPPPTSSNADRDPESEPANRTERTAEAEANRAEAAEEDAEEVGSEWHVWLIAAVVVAGIVLFFAPRFFLPELLGSLGVFLVLIGLLGLVVKWAIGRSG